jgi:hypothetical protein
MKAVPRNPAIHETFIFHPSGLSPPALCSPFTVAGGFGCGDQYAGKVMTSIWSAILLVLLAVITAVWIGVLGYGLTQLIEHAI